MIPIAIALLMTDTTPKSLSDVSKMLADFSKQSAIAVTPTSDSIPIATDAKDVEDMILPLKKQGYATLMSEVGVFYKMGIPPSHLGVLKGLIVAPGAPQPKVYKEVTIPQSAVKDNMITFETKPGEYVKVGTLMNLDLTRRIMVSAYFNSDMAGDFPLAINAKDMPASQFVKALTRGLSGKLAVEQKTYTINFDASNFKVEFNKVFPLAQKGVDEGRTPSGIVTQFSGGSSTDYQEYQDTAQPAQSNSKPALKAALVLLSQTVNSMNDQLLEQTFAYKGTTTRLNLATFTDLQKYAVNYLQSATPTDSVQPGTQSQRQGPGQNNLASLINRVDARNPGRLLITTDFRVSLELNLVARARRGNPNQPQNVDAANKITIQVL
jgi:hypothetical protein